MIVASTIAYGAYAQNKNEHGVLGNDLVVGTSKGTLPVKENDFWGELLPFWG